MAWDSGPVSFFCMWLSSFSSTVYWRGYPFSIVYSWFLCCKLIDHICIGLFLDFLMFHWSLGLFLGQYHTVLLLYVYNIVWNQEAWCLQFCSFFLRIVLPIQCRLWFHANFRIFGSIYVKSAFDTLIEIALNL